MGFTLAQWASHGSFKSVTFEMSLHHTVARHCRLLRRSVGCTARPRAAGHSVQSRCKKHTRMQNLSYEIIRDHHIAEFGITAFTDIHVIHSSTKCQLARKREPTERLSPPRAAFPAPKVPSGPKPRGG